MVVTGKYKIVKSEGMDDYMKEIGVDLVTRTAAKAASQLSTVEYIVDGETYHIKTTGLKDYSLSFKLGAEQEEKTLDGRTVKSIYTLDGNVLTQVETDSKGVTKIVREFKGDELIATVTRGSIVATRHYKKV